VDKWIAANVCLSRTSWRVLSQSNDDFLGMTFKGQSAIMDRASGLTPSTR
jgi:hypothetical protein